MSNTTENDVRSRLQLRMKSLGLNQTSTARKAGVAVTVVKDIMGGRSKNPRADNISKLANALECSVEWLITGKGDIHSSSVPQGEISPYSEDQLDSAIELIADAMEEQDIELELKTVARISLKLLRRASQNLEKLGPGVAHLLVQKAAQNE